ncbi:lysophospholipid acyltransferase family protein [Burkholderiaceae bacterium FT117]|nr:lysophospholipid acyltransferase family protein [Zeimonas sediminis]MCM5571659.1 lysophospholipid acyltransferase family protein [Zeimonas sediminis]
MNESQTSPIRKPTMPPPDDGAPAADGAAARLLAAGFGLLGRLPLGALRALGAVAGLLVFAASGAYRRKLVANLRRAGYPGSGPALRAAAGAGRMALELPWIWRRPPAALAGRVACADLAVLDAVEAEGRGVLFLTPHLGAFEVTARWYALRAPITVLFREPHKALMRPLVRQARNTSSIRAVPAAMAGVRSLLRALRAGEAVGILPDQVPGQGEGEWAPFFGEPAWTMTLPLRLAEATGAAVVLAVGERVPGGWRLHLERMAEAPTPEALNARMEGLVRRWPDQYLWGYNRYKAPGQGAGKARQSARR